MKRVLVPILTLAAGMLLLQQTACADDMAKDVRIVAVSSIKVSKEDTETLKNTVTDYAFQHNFSKPQGWTLPRNRKIMLPPGGFSTTYRGNGDYYLVMHSVMGQDCVAIDVYAAHTDPYYEKLLTDIGQSIQHAMPGKVKTFTGDSCGAK